MRYTFCIALIILIQISCTKNDTVEMCEPNRPNILLIIADDMGIDACPNYPIGAMKPNMPNLVELMNRGVIFDNAWSYPICAPTRASILTGKYGVHTGVLNVEEASTISTNELTLQAYLDQELGKVYSHAIFGKWHLSPDEPNRPNEMGIDHFAGLIGGGVQNYSNWTLTENGSSTQTTEYITTKLTDLAIEWINEQSDPWFCWMAYNAPHTPFHLPPDSLHSQGSLPTDQASIDANPMPYYLAMIESLDHEIGRVMDNIPEDELANTTILFIGDNGTTGEVVQAPYEPLNSKGSLTQGGIHVPLIASGVNVGRSGERDESLVSCVDLFATIADLAGINVINYENSISFAPLLRSQGEHTRTHNYSEVLNLDMPIRSGYTVRNDRYKLINRDNGSFRFYDLEEDPFEQDNITMAQMTPEEENAFTELNEAADNFRN